MISCRILNEASNQNKFEELQAKSRELLKKNDVIIFASSKLKCLDCLPRMNVLDASLKYKY